MSRFTPEDRVGQLIRSCHRFAFRTGEWAIIVKTTQVHNRDCWLIEFPDGVQDTWVCEDPMASYQFATIESGDEQTSTQ